jgi:LysM repeat protein
VRITPSSFAFSLFVLVTVGVTFAPSSSSADVISILSSVFRNANVGAFKEIEQIPTKNIQTMPILAAEPNPLEGTSTVEVLKELKTNASMVEGKALTNENSSVSDGSFTAYPRDMFGNSDRISLYTVRDNDTLEQIARMYGVTPNTILWANDLKKGTLLKPDQVLVILPISSIKYAVQKGDTLQTLAKKFNGDIQEIAQFNNLEEDEKLVVGSELMIPDADGSLLASETKKNEETAKKQKKSNQVKIAESSNSRVDTTGYFIRPVVGGIRTQGLHGHNGIDIAASYGTPILAAASGQVLVSRSGGWGGGYGTYVVIKHPNGTQTLYGHMSQALVSTGESVTKGQQIGKMGNTGQSSGVHLHFEVRGGKNPF